jgi:toxin ParE1/3/4
MAEVVWTEPALDQLNDLTEYIALDKPDAASRLVERVFEATERLAEFPDSGRRPPELVASVYRELVVPPCRIFYRREEEHLYILYVLRQEQEIRRYLSPSE